jgi:hypothetical protein
VRFDVAVDDTVAVCGREGVAKLHTDVQGFREGDGSMAPHPVGQVHPLQKLHGEVVDVLSFDRGAADIEDAYDVTLLNLAGDPGFLLETADQVLVGNQLRLDDLECNPFVQLLIQGCANVAHTARAELTLYAVSFGKKVAGTKNPYS